MNAHVLEGPWWNEHGSKLFKCSECHSSVACNAVQPAYFKFCWNCGVKFEPKPKAEPTDGEWWYTRSISTDQGKVYARDTFGRNELIASVAEVSTTRVTDANGHLLAASKKLLAKLKLLVAVERPTARELVEARAAIAEAEGK